MNNLVITSTAYKAGRYAKVINKEAPPINLKGGAM
jgi:hypothetical protein